MFKKALLLAGLAAFALSSQAKRPEPWTLPLAQELPVEVLLDQPALGVDISNTGAAITSAAVGGILGALIGGAITNAQVSNAEKRVGEIRTLLRDYDFNTRFEAALRAQLEASGVSPGLQVRITRETGDLRDPKSSGLRPAENLLMVQPRYAISANFETLSVSMTLSLVERRAKSNGKLKQLWKGQRSYRYSFPMEKITGSGATEDASRWSDLGATQLQALLDEGITQLMAMMAYDLSPGGLADAQERNKGSTVFAGRKYPGRQVRASDDWIWVRSGNALFASVHGIRPLPSPGSAQDR